MKLPRLLLIAVAILQASCASMSERGTLAQLQRVNLNLEDTHIEGGIEKAMQSYQQFLMETPESAMTPDAIRRLADLKIEREYGTYERPDTSVSRQALPAAPPAMARPEQASITVAAVAQPGEDDGERETEADFEARASGQVALTDSNAGEAGELDELANQGAEEAIALYQQLLEQYPDYDRNDQVLYQMTRAFEELGRTEEAVEVMNRIVVAYPHSRHFDEVQFRRGEYYFTRNRWLDAEEAYQAITAGIGSSSFYYELALYKLGWTFYKQDLLEEGLDQFVALLDYKVQTGYDFESPADASEAQRIEDTHRVISLSFSAMGGPDSVVDYFQRNGARRYEVDVYRNLGEHYLDMRRYSDAASAYRTFVELNPYHQVAPHFDMRIIDIYKQGGFPSLVIEANKAFTVSYGLSSDYWRHFEVESYPDVVTLLKDTLQELASYYHARYQNPALVEEQGLHFAEAQHWYQQFLGSFPRDQESPQINHQLADLLLEHRSFAAAAHEYERTAYDYPAHDKAAEAGYAAVYAHREHLAETAEEQQAPIKDAVIRSSLRFADTFPEHDSASLVMGAALEDIFAMENHQFAVVTGHKMLERFPEAPQQQRRAAWLVVAHSSYELDQYADAESAYLSVLQLTDEQDESRPELLENLAASIYRQGEQAADVGDYEIAASHFLRLGNAAANSRLRPAAEYDAANAFLALQDWSRAAEVLRSFRSHYPGHELQSDVTKKLAHVYSESDQLALAAQEYERIESESDDEQIRREALKVAAEMYNEVGNQDQAIVVYRRFIEYFPTPPEPVLVMHQQIADVLKARDDTHGYRNELEQIVAIDAGAGAQRTDRMRLLAGRAALVLAEPLYQQFVAIELTQPFERTLAQKRDAMRAANRAFNALTEYEVGEVTAAATWYVAEVYSNFSRSLMASERPAGLSELEMMQYEDLLDEQAYPFEEQAINIHQQNIGFIDMGIFNQWVEKSVASLAAMVPGRFARFEESSGLVASIDSVDYSSLTHPYQPEPELEPGAEPESAPEELGAASDADQSSGDEAEPAEQGDSDAADEQDSDEQAPPSTYSGEELAGGVR